MAQAIAGPTTNRRRFLSRSVAAAAAPALGVSVGGDRELLAFEREIASLYREARLIYAEGVAPFSAEHERLVRAFFADGQSQRALTVMLSFDQSSGRGAALDAEDKLLNKAYRLMEPMWTIAATSPAGRIAKVRVLLPFIMHADEERWLGPDGELDFDVSMCRRLLGEFAGMNAAELAAVE